MSDQQFKNNVSLETQQQSNPLTRKLNKVLETRLENDKEMIDVLKTVSTFFPENNIRSRRSLRGNIERRILDINQQFSDAFSYMMKDLESIHSDVSEMSHCCNDMMTRLSKTKEQTQELITKTNKLNEEEEKVELQSKVATSFIDKFQLSPEEIQMFRSTKDYDLHPNFLQVLKKVQRIHKEVKILLRTTQQKAGLAIMEQMAMHQETGFEKLYRWSQLQCRSMTTPSIDITNKQQEALQALQLRFVLFTYCMDEYASARRGTIMQGFIDALTRGKPSNVELSRNPIEMHAHDPIKYVGNILAWLHQAVAEEKDNCTQLLQLCNQSTEEIKIKTLVQIFEGIAETFYVRVEQVLGAEKDNILVLFKLTNLLKFYNQKICEFIGESTNVNNYDRSYASTSLVGRINEINLLCRSMFFTALKLFASDLLDKVESPPRDLSPPLKMNNSLKLLREIFETHDTSMVQICDRKEVLVQVMTHLIDPLIKMCTMSASHLKIADMACFMINCLHQIKFLLSLYEFTDKKIEMLSAQIDAHTDTLVTEQTSELLLLTGLSNVYKLVIMNENNPEIILSEVKGLDRTSVVTCFQHFEQAALHTYESTLHQITMLSSATLKEVVTTRSRDMIANAYSIVYEAFNDPKNKYEPCAAKTPEQIKLLLC